jgi:hypothetical protein
MELIVRYSNAVAVADRQLVNSVTEGERPHVRYRHRWEDNIKMDIKEIQSECLGWIHVAEVKDQPRAVADMKFLTS